MSQQDIVYQWYRAVRKEMTPLSKPQAFNLAAFSFGLARARRCTLRFIAEQLWCLGKPDSMERRLQRLLANQKMQRPECTAALTAWAVQSLPQEGRVVLLVDETSLQDKLKVMVVRLAYRRRALPLAWWCYPRSDGPGDRWS